MRAALLALLIVAGATLDLATKAWARASLEPYGAASDFLPFVSLRLTFNHGISFSMFSFDGDIGKAVLLAATGLMTLVMTGWAYVSQGWQRTALTLIAAGALGNLLDRALRGSVTDFLGLHFGEWYPFVFNVADIWISLGFIGLIVFQLKKPEPGLSSSELSHKL